MKMSKLLLLVVLMLALCTLSTSLFTACGGDENGDAVSSVESSTPDIEEEDKAAEGRDEFIDSLGGVSDTFEGAVSEESYDTAEEAANAYVSNEIAGDFNVESVDAVSKGELSDKDVKALDLPEELSNGITSVEKFEVSYELSEEKASSLASSRASTKIIVYVIRYGKEYKYYTPCPADGETITKSYYDSVFDKEKYENCTFVNTSYVEVKAGFQKLSATVTQTIKRDGGKILFEQKITGDSQLTGQLGGSSPYLAAYMETDENGDTTTYVKQSEFGSWTEGYLYGVNAESVVPFADQYLDYTYFSKTNFGFALKGDNALRFYTETINANASNQNVKVEIISLDMYAEYYVVDGVLSGMRMEYEGNLKASAQGQTQKQTTIGENTMTCSDYGTTVVEKPF